MRELFSRGLGGVYLIAFTSLRAQLLGLYGKRGISSVGELLEKVRAVTGRERYRRLPTVLWLDASDRSLVRACELGQSAAALLALGVAPRLMSAASWALYLSFVTVGQEFLGYQWDALLLEAGLYATVAAPAGIFSVKRDEETPAAAVWLMRWLVFRLHFESGLCKLKSRDPAWRSCTACAYHYESQPLPTPVAWWAHLLPRPFQRLSTLLTLVIECGVPFLVFTPKKSRRSAFAILTGLQALIELTGNYGFFNLLTVLLDVWLLDDRTLDRQLRLAPRPPPRPAPWWRRLFTLAASLPAFALSGGFLLARLRKSHRLPRALVRLHQALAPLHAVNPYGLFAVMTTRRPEIVIEGSRDGVKWREYEFRYKPGAVTGPPRFVAPHQPRLDWQMWFAALGSPRPWFERFLARLLEGAPEVSKLLARNPFSDRPPKYVRALLYEYRMTDRATRRRTGAWWTRELLGLYFPAARLSEASS
ncbi:MAG TPA: lipase maturation factor family protein [Polyangia bacterium]